MPGNETGPEGCKLSIVIPCFNEEAQVVASLERVLAAAMPAGWEREVIIVDDASTDGTREILRSLQLPIRVLYRECNGGKGSALVDGFAEVSGTHVLIQDADLEYDPNDIPKLLAELGFETSVVYGSRNLSPNRPGAYGARLGVWLSTKVVNMLYGTRLTDTFTCYKLFPNSAISLFKQGGFDAELLFTAALIREGYVISEVPISYAPRSRAEGKKIRYADGLHALWALIRDYRAHKAQSGIIRPIP